MADKGAGKLWRDTPDALPLSYRRLRRIGFEPMAFRLDVVPPASGARLPMLIGSNSVRESARTNRGDKSVRELLNF